MAKLEPMPAIVIDTREQTPWQFAVGIATVRDTLETGDYSLAGFEDRVAVERKSLADLVGCMKGDGRERFRNELRRLEEMRPGPAVIVVEATYTEILAHCYRSEMSPASVAGMMLGWIRDYPRVHWILAGDRAAQVCYDYLRIWSHGPVREWRRVQQALKRAAKEG